MAEKSEKATPKKLRDARKKGQVAKSQDFPSAITFIVAVTLTLAMAHTLYLSLGNYMLNCFRLVPYAHLYTQAKAIVFEGLTVILYAALPIAGIVAIVGVLVNFLIIGPVFTFEVFKPNFKKFNPVTNIKEKFKLKTLVELIKSLLKVFIAALLVYWVMKASVADIIQTASFPVIATALLFNMLLIKVIIHVGIFFLVVALFDLIYQKRVFAKEMKMEKFEVKQEYKDTEGNPEIKGKRRHLAQEIAYDEGAGAVKRAKAVVTNPTHLAVAVAYEPGKYPAPFIVAKGSDLLAELIIKAAERYNVPIMRNVDLARLLYAKGRLNEYIPVEAYEAVAELLRIIAESQQEEQ